MNKIGIFLGFQYKSKIKSEGIGRLLGFMLKADMGEKIVVAMPEWLKKEFMELVMDQDISMQNIEIITTKSIPYSLRTLEMLKNIRNRKKSSKGNKFYKLKSYLTKYIQKKLNNIVSSKNIFNVIFSLLYLAVGAILLAPLLIVVYITMKLKQLVKKIIKSLVLVGKKVIKKVFKIIYSTNRMSNILHNLYEILHHSELETLVAEINKRKDISMWYVPALFWPEVEKIEAKKIIAAPDIVYYDFPIQFATCSDQVMYNKLAKTIKCADHIICYSEYVKYNHIVEKFDISEKNVTVISHGCIEMDQYLNVKKSIQGHISQEKIAIEVIENYVDANISTKEIIRKINWGEIRFIIYSSQCRPHKNILSLIKAIEILNREKYLNIKLILTGHIYENEDIAAYIRENNMQNEIIEFYNIPTKVLAALNKLAICAINPTMFEGGFPFTFTEAYSMGTPSVMSSIPVVIEKIQNEDLMEKMLFDPYDVDSMVEKLDWALENKEYLYNMQHDLYEQFKQRNWDCVIMEYADLFKYV